MARMTNKKVARTALVEVLAEREAVERAGVGELALAEGVGESGEGFGRELGEEGEKLGEE